MPDHFHLLLTPQGITIERAIGLIKGGFSHRLETNYPFWQKGFHDRRIRDSDEFLAQRHYIHQNPVVAGLVERAGDYPFSSAFTSAAKAAPADAAECDG